MKSNDQQIEKLTKRPIQYWFEDGIGEMVTGGLFFLIGITFSLQAMFTTSLVSLFISLLSVIVIGGGVIFSRFVINRMKERIVYPRTGYVGYSKHPSKRKIGVTIGITIAVAISVVLLGSSSSTLDWTPIVIGAICGALMFYQAYQTRIFRLTIEAAFAILIGIIIAFSGISGMLSSSIFLLLYGLILVVGGGLTLRSYIKKAPPTLNREV